MSIKILNSPTIRLQDKESDKMRVKKTRNKPNQISKSVHLKRIRSKKINNINSDV
jgi:hypothetical protein